MIERVLEIITRYSMFAPGQRAGVAVSGGADSVCLLHVLRELAPRLGICLSVLHLDHGLRGDESRADAAFVRSLAADLGLSFHLRETGAGRLRGERSNNLEQAARDARRDFFLGLIRDGVVDRVALGHTRSDQAETVLFRLLRGAGTAGLAGMRPVSPEGIVRPLLEVSRGEVEAWLRDRKLPWREDSTNRSLDFARNRIRHEVLPLLSRSFNPALEETLARTAAIARDEEEYWARQVERLARTHLEVRPPVVLAQTGPLAALPLAAARRLARHAIGLARGGLRSVDAAHVEEVLLLARRPQGHGRCQIPGLDVRRSYDWIRLAPAGEPCAAEGFCVGLTVPAMVPIPGSGAILRMEVIESTDQKRADPGSCSGYNNEGEGVLDLDRIAGPLLLRNWRPGDRYRPAGREGQAKVKDLFQRARIPVWDRAGWPVLECGGAVVWVRRFGPAAEVAPGASARNLLRVWEMQDPATEWNPSAQERRLYR